MGLLARVEYGLDRHLRAARTLFLRIDSDRKELSSSLTRLASRAAYAAGEWTRRVSAFGP